MLYLSQVNFDTNLASKLGIIYAFSGIAYLIFMIFWLVKNANRLNGLALFFYISQVIFAPLIMGLCGLILIFKGWRLDPILQLMQLFLFVLIIYLVIKDIVINAVYRNR